MTEAYYCITALAYALHLNTWTANWSWTIIQIPYKFHGNFSINQKRNEMQQNLVLFIHCYIYFFFCFDLADWIFVGFKTMFVVYILKMGQFYACFNSYYNPTSFPARVHTCLTIHPQATTGTMSGRRGWLFLIVFCDQRGRNHFVFWRTIYTTV